jgi:molecular chaperone DnaJ
MDAMFGGSQTSRGPLAVARPDALVRLDLPAGKAARHSKPPGDTKVPARAATGRARRRVGTRCGTCHGQGDVTHIQRSFIGDIRPLKGPTPWFRTVIQYPCVECSGDGGCVQPAFINVKIPVRTPATRSIGGAREVTLLVRVGDLYVELNVLRRMRCSSASVTISKWWSGF